MMNVISPRQFAERYDAAGFNSFHARSEGGNQSIAVVDHDDKFVALGELRDSGLMIVWKRNNLPAEKVAQIEATATAITYARTGTHQVPLSAASFLTQYPKEKYTHKPVTASSGIDAEANGVAVLNQDDQVVAYGEATSNGGLLVSRGVGLADHPGTSRIVRIESDVADAKARIQGKAEHFQEITRAAIVAGPPVQYTPA